jgi:flavin reductase (DIM6/NTAB) family NADH-FMN oxidoreductase RutF
MTLDAATSSNDEDAPSPKADVVGPDAFRATMASICTPVTVVTALDDGRPHGTTVSAFSSLSLEPPLILVALDRGSDLLSIVRAGGRFGVNLLSHLQDELALQFARKGPDKFDGVSWHDEGGIPRLEESSGWLACTLESLVDGGDHVVAIGLVVAAEPIAAAPLVYQNRRFGTHSDFVGTDASGEPTP